MCNPSKLEAAKIYSLFSEKRAFCKTPPYFAKWMSDIAKGVVIF